MRLNVKKLREHMESRQIGPTDLARASRLSRGTISRLLSGGRPNVHPGTEGKLAAALGLAPGALDKQGPEGAYLEAVAERDEFLDITGLGIIDGSGPVPMDRAYAPLTLRQRQDEEACPPGGEHLARIASRVRHRPKSLSLQEALGRSRRLFLLGDPGSGKTTALRRLARVYARRGQQPDGCPPDRLAPVFVSLPKWAEQLGTDPQTDLADAALAQLTVPDLQEAAKWLREQIRSEKTFMLLDGLDEVADPDARALVIEGLR
ncbi:MAG TPA: helix-turn-helix domain-containing protein, partial [Phycisphaerae bacterium]|nr:helix-turn-helix domain-containing protein [Phycisphaerae bacterium]